ncbi:hypothetical protein [Niveispirillum cyanobacteriorum]|uniref:Uncharacterized protein n=1 Tax=Niveispirillum cyanobacteriorum TaxID=1612173 RepID=A0A2K9NFM5_9PROT|nr:hypothetical protein [Niveispirillum cyanobacteriorum]AUN31930.1 hypothetical protein C0V82_15985 [Niveispirillum cyanobacteriorum]GGE85670.1 hypothetical protein GCM10011317_48580 [Niveispirillum cyanobacteriorum]
MAQTEDTLRVSNRGVVLPMALVGALLAAVWFAAVQSANVADLSARVRVLEGRADDQHKAWTAIDVRLARMEVTLQSLADSVRRDQRDGGPR